VQDNPDYLDLMLRFRRAFSRADRDALGQVLGPWFEWHTHTFDPANPTPTGRVLRGIDEVLTEIAWRNKNWSDVRYDGLVERCAPNLVTQTFTISGVDRSRHFEVKAVDLYTIDDDDLILRKDTYWKQPMV
jgi:hypothetical protein